MAEKPQPTQPDKYSVSFRASFESRLTADEGALDVSFKAAMERLGYRPQDAKTSLNSGEEKSKPAKKKEENAG